MAKQRKNHWQRSRAVRRLTRTPLTAETLLPTLHTALARALAKAGLSATVVHEVQHRLVKLTNIKHNKALAPSNPEYGLLVHYTPSRSLHVVVFSQPVADRPMRLIFTKSGSLEEVLADLTVWKKRHPNARELPPATYRVVIEQLRNLAAAAPKLFA